LIASDRHEWVSNHERKSNPNPNPNPNPNLALILTQPYSDRSFRYDTTNFSKLTFSSPI